MNDRNTTTTSAARKRQRYTKGSIQRQRRAHSPDVWTWRFPSKDASGKLIKPRIVLGTVLQFRSLSAAEAERDRRLVHANPIIPAGAVTFAELLDRYVTEELPPLSLSYKASTTSLIKCHVRPRWGTSLVTHVKALEVKKWLDGIKDFAENHVSTAVRKDLAAKTKGNIRALMSKLFECAMLWEYLEVQRNPMELVVVRGSSKRQRQPLVLTVDQLWQVFDSIPDALNFSGFPRPWRTMAVVQFCFGLRRSEIVALKWSDIEWLNERVKIQRRFVESEVEESTKSEASHDHVPMHASVAQLFLQWRSRTPFAADTDFVFASPYAAGEKPYHPNGYQQLYFGPAGRKVGIPDLGTHDLRHTYRAWVDETGASMGVQQKLMRHASITTTAKYGSAMQEPCRAANAAVVTKVFNA